MEIKYEIKCNYFVIMNCEHFKRLMSENAQLKSETDTVLRMLRETRLASLQFSLNVANDRVQTDDIIRGQNEFIKDLNVRISDLEAALSKEREVVLKMASEQQNWEFQENMRKLNFN